MNVWLAIVTRDALIKDARGRWREIGGGLFGYVSHDAIVIDGHSVGSGRSASTATSFRPDVGDLQTHIDRVISESGGRRYLVGEWHTHPTGSPYLSPTDVASVRRAASTPGVGLSQPVAIVVAPTVVSRRRPPRLAAFAWDAGAQRPVRTDVRLFEQAGSEPQA